MGIIFNHLFDLNPVVFFKKNNCFMMWHDVRREYLSMKEEIKELREQLQELEGINLI